MQGYCILVWHIQKANAENIVWDLKDTKRGLTWPVATQSKLKETWHENWKWNFDNFEENHSLVVEKQSLYIHSRSSFFYQEFINVQLWWLWWQNSYWSLFKFRPTTLSGSKICAQFYFQRCLDLKGRMFSDETKKKAIGNDAAHWECFVDPPDIFIICILINVITTIITIITFITIIFFSISLMLNHYCQHLNHYKHDDIHHNHHELMIIAIIIITIMMIAITIIMIMGWWWLPSSQWLLVASSLSLLFLVDHLAKLLKKSW